MIFFSMESDSFSFIIKEIFPLAPQYTIGASRFNEEKYTGRFLHYLNMINPKTLFIPQQRLDKYVATLKRFERGDFLNVDSSTNNYLWEAAKYVSANIHPDTGKRIFPLFTMSGFVLSGIPIVAGLLSPGQQSMRHILFFQWLNQTQNACFNFANRNSSMPCHPSLMIKSYFLATTSAMGIAVGLQSLVNKYDPKSIPPLCRKMIPFVSVAFANLVNLISMRYPEFMTGIKITDKMGNELGLSKVAAKQAIMETAITRVILPIPILLIPPVIMSYFLKKNWVTKHPKYVYPINVGVCTLCFFFAMPMAIALFPQKSKILKSKLEDSLHDQHLFSNQDPYVYFNKGI